MCAYKLYVLANNVSFDAMISAEWSLKFEKQELITEIAAFFDVTFPEIILYLVLLCL